jgi:hypothetical protein
MNGGVTVWIVVMAFIRSAVSNIVSPQLNSDVCKRFVS